jgi:hypothetical protein
LRLDGTVYMSYPNQQIPISNPKAMHYFALAIRALVQIEQKVIFLHFLKFSYEELCRKIDYRSL